VFEKEIADLLLEPAEVLNVQVMPGTIFDQQSKIDAITILSTSPTSGPLLLGVW
jgi:hypothetical protein